MKNKNNSLDKQSLFIYIIIGLVIFYSGYAFLKLISSAISLDIKLLFNLVMVITLLIYLIAIYVGVNFFRGKVVGWYGSATLFIILILKGIVVILSIVSVLIFKDSLFKNANLAKFNLNSNVVFTIVEFVIAIIMTKLLFSTDVINGFYFKNSSKLGLILKVAAITVISLVLYFGSLELFLLVQN